MEGRAVVARFAYLTVVGTYCRKIVGLGSAGFNLYYLR